MKRLIIVLAFLLSAGLAFAGGGYDVKPQPQEQRTWGETFTRPQKLIEPAYKWGVRDYTAVGSFIVTTIGVAGSLYFNSRRKKKLK